MPMARTRRGRLKQAEAWLRLYFPPALRTVVRVGQIPRGSEGDCSESNNHLLVRVNKNLTWYIAIETLLHEWAHAVAWPREAEDHNRAWSDVYGKIYRHWYQDGGAEESRKL